MSVEGVPSVDDVAAAIQEGRWGEVSDSDALSYAEAVVALYAPVLERLEADIAEERAEHRINGGLAAWYREAMGRCAEKLESVGNQEPLEVARYLRAALADDRGTTGVCICGRARNQMKGLGL